MFLVPANAIYQAKCLFTDLSALFLFFGSFPMILDYFLCRLGISGMDTQSNILELKLI